MSAKGISLVVLIVIFTVSLSEAASMNKKNVAPNVNFTSYNEEAFISAKRENKPIFILFFAHWCPWCKSFNENTLSEALIYEYLNEHYINIFVDVDQNEILKAKYGVTMLPYIVMLRPDGKLEYKYGGTLDRDGFFGFIKETKKKALK